ncbi:SH3 domain-containing protein [Pseudooceanicola sp. GBMRC 2024]|uniref:SH3 domain-containing protein n=1 Tax=Pseudooceanicola albus TaxID=2692189 RepID=A0A6L7G532_9RHOB|nr:SH3 domain-containing protein [Pseudooceanicola albus]MXN17743.1 SH3 domain-containing protein [Pseudooceanicola albus]
MRRDIGNLRAGALRGLFLCLAVALSGPLAAQEGRSVETRFATGMMSASYSDAITGYESVNYFLQARAGQIMAVAFSASNLSAYFNVWGPGADTALFAGAAAGDRFTGVLPESGRYRIQVYLMRNAARRGETARYRLDLRVSDAPPAADYADGLAGGPDWWVVRDLPPRDRLNLRAGPGTGFGVLGKIPEGAALRNLGCRMSGNSRWCEVETPGGGLRGWVSGRYLREGAAPPQLHLRPGGETEIRFADGCTLLFSPAGKQVAAGASCTPDHFARAARAVAPEGRAQGQ